MAELAFHEPLTGHAEFDDLIAKFAEEPDPEKAEAMRQGIWDTYGTEGTVFISDMASFSSTSRKIGVCHFLKMIHRARQIIAPIVEGNNGMLLKCDADNCYAFFRSPDDAIKAIVIKGAGDRAFCAGGDVRAVRQSIVERCPPEAAVTPSRSGLPGARSFAIEKQGGIVQNGGGGILGIWLVRLVSQTPAT